MMKNDDVNNEIKENDIEKEKIKFPLAPVIVIGSILLICVILIILLFVFGGPI